MTELDIRIEQLGTHTYYRLLDMTSDYRRKAREPSIVVYDGRLFFICARTTVLWLLFFVFHFS